MHKDHRRVPVLVVTTTPHAARQTNTVFTLYPCLVSMPLQQGGAPQYRRARRLPTFTLNPTLLPLFT